MNSATLSSSMELKARSERWRRVGANFWQMITFVGGGVDSRLTVYVIFY